MIRISQEARGYAAGFADVDLREVAAAAFQAGMNHETAKRKSLQRLAERGAPHQKGTFEEGRS